MRHTHAKKFLDLLVAVCLLVGALPMAVSAAASVSGDGWTLKDGVLTFSAYENLGNTQEIGYLDHKGEITSVVVQPGVTEVLHCWLEECPNVTSVTLPDTVKVISHQAFFGCNKLTSITLPSGVNKIGEAAFAGCSSLISITIPNGVTSISGDTFSGCASLTSVTIPNSVTSIREYAFINCTSLTSITIPDSVTSISVLAFDHCTNLTSVTIPDSVTDIGENAFYDCPNLTIYGVTGSAAETYAKENNIPFVAGKAPDDPAKPSKPTVAGFSDVFQDDYYADSVQWAVENGITAGTDGTHFSPNVACTRAQAVTFLWRAAGKPEPESATMKFTDVKAGEYYEKAVQWAVENGITSGTGNGKFSPSASCTRAQIVSFMYRAEGSPEIAGSSSFGDVAAGDYFADAVKWAAGNNITAGTSADTFSPNDNCTRGQIVTFLYRNK